MNIRNFLAVVGLTLAGLGGPVQAQGYGKLSYYLTTIGPEDMRNSSGAKLGSIAQVIQQDRANVHRFGIRHAGDEVDPVFGTRSLRAQIPGVMRFFGNEAARMADIRAGRGFRVGVFVCGTPGRPSAVLVLDMTIGDFSGCF